MVEPELACSVGACREVYAEKFAEEVDRLSGGSIKIQVYANSTLGGDRELLESCKDGDIPFVVQNTAPQVTFMPDLAIFDVPCAFENLDECREVLDDPEFSTLISSVYEKGGYQLLGVADQGFRIMSTNKPVKGIGDFKGQKIRTMENRDMLIRLLRQARKILSPRYMRKSSQKKWTDCPVEA